MARKLAWFSPALAMLVDSSGARPATAALLGTRESRKSTRGTWHMHRLVSEGFSLVRAPVLYLHSVLKFVRGPPCWLSYVVRFSCLQAAERLAAECEAAQTRCALLEDRLAEMRVERGQLDTYKQARL